MPDVEKVIKGLVEALMAIEVSVPERYRGYSIGAIKDAITLLKAQGPKLVHVTANINHRKIGECPTCGKLINSGDYPNYCGQCGQAVKWE